VPTYSFACRDCDHRFEQVLSIHHSTLPACSACGGEVRKVISNVAVTFKGSGFYRTDSRPAASKSSSTSDSAPAPAPAASATSTAPASKPAPAKSSD